jgi:3-hydroxyacyl-CoA dehydrogenase/enoyl-CoA hydratase/3-hydroxybutyryl-CoA epimerase
VVEKMSHGFKRGGRAVGGGFYDYGSQPPQLWSGLRTFERRSRQLPPEEVRDRLLHAAIAAALDSEPDPRRSTAFVQCFGRSLPADAQGAEDRVRTIGAEAFASRAAALAERFGPRFALPRDALARLGVS